MHWRPGGQQPARAGPYRRRRHRAYRRGHLPDGPGRRLSARSTRRAPWAQRTGIAHNLAAIPVFFGLPAALACSRRSWRTGQRAFALYSTGTAITMLTTMTLAAAGFGQSPWLVNHGLFQGASIITGFSWLTTLSARELQHSPAPGCAGPPVA